MLTVSVTIINTWVNAAINRGVSVDQILEQTGINKEILKDMDQRISLAQHDEFLEKLFHKVDDEFFGFHTGSQVSYDAFGIVGYMFKTSENIEQALSQFLRYSKLIAGIGKHKLYVKNGVATFGFRFIDDYNNHHWQISDFAQAAAVALLNSFLDHKLELLEVNFAHKNPYNDEKYQRYFACKIHYETAFTEIKFDASVLKQPMTGNSPELHATLKKHADNALKSLSPHEEIIHRIRKHLANNLQKDSMTLEKVAAALKLNPRTLQRRLKELDVRYIDILNEVRKELAIQHLNVEKLTIVDVAYLLGYSESAPFLRAFKRWYGVTPSEYRKNMKQLIPGN